MEDKISFCLKRLEMLEKKLERYFDFLQKSNQNTGGDSSNDVPDIEQPTQTIEIENELDFIINGTYVLETEIASILNGEY